MALNQSKILQKLRIVRKPKKAPKINVRKDIDAIEFSLKNVQPVIKELQMLFKKFKALRAKEKKAAGAEKVKLIQEQVMVYDKILRQYEYYELDVDINGERVKKISTVLGKKAKDANISAKWLNKIKKSERWTFDW